MLFAGARRLQNAAVWNRRPQAAPTWSAYTAPAERRLLAAEGQGADSTHCEAIFYWLTDWGRRLPMSPHGLLTTRSATEREKENQLAS